MIVFPREQLEDLIRRDGLPGIDATEVRVIREFLRRYGANYREYRFNVRVGEGTKLVGDYPEKFAAYWERVTQMRMDLVCWNPPNQATLVEAKVQWTNDAVWQLLSYRDAYARDFNDEIVALAGVAEAYTSSAWQLASDRGIRLYIYGFPPALPAAPATSEHTP
jgi:hypothetical protein